MNIHPTSVEEIQAFVQKAERLLPRGGGSKPALSRPAYGIERLDLRELSGILEYQPVEFTFTALAGTPLAHVEQTLAEHGQYMPFDPLFVQAGATLGGTVAAGASGPGRYRFGGVRDFILGIRYVNGAGQLIRSGGKVVKNAAGFDLPKLMVGSRGALGVLVELSFKVFPRPEASSTLRLDCINASYSTALQQAEHIMHCAAGARLDVHAIELQPARSSALAGSGDGQAGYTVWVRLSGLEKTLAERLERLRLTIDEDLSAAEKRNLQWQILVGNNETQFWREAREMAWAQGEYCLVKVPITPKRISGLEQVFMEDKAHCTRNILRRYSVAGQVAWLAYPPPLDDLGRLLLKLDLAGLVFWGEGSRTQLGNVPGASFMKRVKSALDPLGRFVVPG